MKEKIVEKYQYNGAGFPFELTNVKMIQIGDEFQPLIDVKKVAEKILQSLSKQEHFTINQLLFVKSSLQMSAKAFAKLVNMAEDDIKQWNVVTDKPVNLDANVVSAVQRYIKNHLKAQTPYQLLSSKGTFSAGQDKPAENNLDKQTSTSKKKNN